MTPEQIEQMRAENLRLRATLDAIAGLMDDLRGAKAATARVGIGMIAEIARAALKDGAA